MNNTTQIKVTLEQEDDYAFRIRFDDTTLAPLLSDEPAPLGQDRGPNPARLLLASVANCLVASLLFAPVSYTHLEILTHQAVEVHGCRGAGVALIVEHFRHAVDYRRQFDQQCVGILKRCLLYTSRCV